MKKLFSRIIMLVILIGLLMTPVHAIDDNDPYNRHCVFKPTTSDVSVRILIDDNDPYK